MTTAIYIIGAICTILMLWLAHHEPHDARWDDNDDCSHIVQHTTRILAATERLSMWDKRYQFVRQHAPRLSLETPLIEIKLHRSN